MNTKRSSTTRFTATASYLSAVILSLALVGLTVRSGHAVTCTVDTDNPDAYLYNTVANSPTHCNVGSGMNDPGPGGGSIPGLTGTFVYIDREAGSPGPGFSEAN